MKMVEVKTAELIWPALDWAVAKVEGHASVGPSNNPVLFNWNIGKIPRYSTDWAQGGPLIDKHITALNQSGTETYWAHCEDHLGLGPTALVAACRAIVAAKLGDVVSVPAELVNGGGV